jgi:hypothetical protein
MKYSAAAKANLHINYLPVYEIQGDTLTTVREPPGNKKTNILEKLSVQIAYK